MTKFNDFEVQTLRRILYGTWEYIGNDIMDSLLAEGRTYISRSDVVEVVLDADHCGKMVSELKANELWGRFSAMPYKERIRFAKKYVFLEVRYA
mgnify:CR=1 FL=1